MGEGTVIAGVDTHKDVHVLCLLDELGRMLETESFSTDAEGYDKLARRIGDPEKCIVVGIEGTASYGAGLTRRLSNLGYNVVEVLRPKRDQNRIGEGKSDPLDAERAARRAASGKGCSTPKSQDGWVEAIRHLNITRKLAVATSTSAVACAKSLLTTAPEPLRRRFCGLDAAKDLMLSFARKFRPADALEEVALASLRSIAKIWKEAREQVETCDERIRELLEANAPALLGVQCCGTSIAAALVAAAGDNPERMRSEAAFASLCGVSPIPASSGKTARHRLNRGGNRQANWALYQIAIKRMAYDERTIAYVSKRTAEGKSRKEIIRCLKRYIAREIYHVLLNPNPEDAAPTGPHLKTMRKEMGLTQKEIAEALGTWAATISNLETGKTRSTKLEKQYYELLCDRGRNAPMNCS